MSEIINLSESKNEIKAPPHLTAKQKKRFNELANELQKRRLLSTTDLDMLAMYVTSVDFHNEAAKQLSTKEVQEDPYLLEQFSKLQDRYFKQVKAAANELGFTLSSRHRMDIPTTAKKESKFAKFQKAGAE